MTASIEPAAHRLARGVGLADGLTLVQLSPPLSPALDIAAAMAAVAILCEWRRLATIARVFRTLASLLYAGRSVLLPPTHMALVERALHQGVGFSSFLSMLGTLRYAMSQSGISSRSGEIVAGLFAPSALGR
jgi:hypothetical protein